MRTTATAATFTAFLFGSLLVSSVCEAGDCKKVEHPSFTRAEAEQIALDYLGGGEVIGSERGCERGRDVYEIEIRAKKDGLVHEVAVAVDDGSIVDDDIDDD
jgi:uncharacterized membrane protein YkoI